MSGTKELAQFGVEVEEFDEQGTCEHAPEPTVLRQYAAVDAVVGAGGTLALRGADGVCIRIFAPGAWRTARRVTIT